VAGPLGLVAVSTLNTHLLACQTLKDAKAMKVLKKKLHLWESYLVRSSFN
jgi:hypothetical protein